MLSEVWLVLTGTALIKGMLSEVLVPSDRDSLKKPKAVQTSVSFGLGIEINSKNKRFIPLDLDQILGAELLQL
jgi:hypothetical protein